MSVALSKDLVAKLDRLASPCVSRSSLIETVLREFVDRPVSARRHALEVSMINRHAAKLNAEMKDALSFQSAATVKR